MSIGLENTSYGMRKTLNTFGIFQPQRPQSLRQKSYFFVNLQFLPVFYQEMISVILEMHHNFFKAKQAHQWVIRLKKNDILPKIKSLNPGLPY